MIDKGTGFQKVCLQNVPNPYDNQPKLALVFLCCELRVFVCGERGFFFWGGGVVCEELSFNSMPYRILAL